eukprot:7385247-Prymnesium_polylepis.1
MLAKGKIKKGKEHSRKPTSGLVQMPRMSSFTSWSSSRSSLSSSKQSSNPSLPTATPSSSIPGHQPDQNHHCGRTSSTEDDLDLKNDSESLAVKTSGDLNVAQVAMSDNHTTHAYIQDYTCVTPASYLDTCIQLSRARLSSQRCHLAQVLEAQRSMNKTRKKSLKFGTDAVYADLLSVRSVPFPVLLAGASRQLPLAMTSIAEKKMLKLLGISSVEQQQIQGLQIRRRSLVEGQIELTEEQLKSRAILRLAADPPPAVGNMQRCTAKALLRPYPDGMRFSGKNMSPQPWCEQLSTPVQPASATPRALSVVCISTIVVTAGWREHKVSR